MKKILYFEGAGSVSRGQVENCRIRTAFHNDFGKRIYLEILGTEIREGKGGAIIKNVAFIEFCFYITENNYEGTHIVRRGGESFAYSKLGILYFVNSLGCSFDEIAVLPKLAGYYVHAEKRGYNDGDIFNYDKELTERREKINQYYYDFEKSEGKEYPNFSMWVDSDNRVLLHLMRRFNGYNRHWLIDAAAENWQDTVTQIPLNSPGQHGVAE